MMLRFEESALLSGLSKLEGTRRALFACMTATRLVPSYEMYAKRMQKDCSELHAAIDYIWEQLLTHEQRQHDQSQVEKFNASLAALMPEEEGGPSLFAPQAEDAVAATMYALRCLVHGDAQEAAWAARRAYESADNLVLTRPTVEIGGFEEDKILRDPLIQEELSQQARDLLDASVTKIDRDALIKLRNNCLQWGRDHLQRATS